MIEKNRHKVSLRYTTEREREERQREKTHQDTDV